MTVKGDTVPRFKSHNENVLLALFVRCPCFSTSAEIESIASAKLYHPACLLRLSSNETLFPVFSISPLSRPKDQVDGTKI